MRKKLLATVAVAAMAWFGGVAAAQSQMGSESKKVAQQTRGTNHKGAQERRGTIYTPGSVIDNESITDNAGKGPFSSARSPRRSGSR
jgi:hypothetical protein